MAGLNERGRPIEGPNEGRLTTAAGPVSAFTAPAAVREGNAAKTLASLGQFSRTLSVAADRAVQRKDEMQKIDEEAAAEAFLADANFEDVGAKIASGDINVMGGPHYRALILARHGENLALRRRAEIQLDYAKNSEINPDYDSAEFIAKIREQDVAQFGENPILATVYNKGMANVDAQMQEAMGQTQLKETGEQNKSAAVANLTNIYDTGIAEGWSPEQLQEALQQSYSDNTRMFGIDRKVNTEALSGIIAKASDAGDRDRVLSLLALTDEDGRTLDQTNPEAATRIKALTFSKYTEKETEAYTLEMEPVMAEITAAMSPTSLGDIEEPIAKARAIGAAYTARTGKPGFGPDEEAKLRSQYASTYRSEQDRADAKAQQAEDRRRAIERHNLEVGQQIESENRITTAVVNGDAAYLPEDERKKAGVKAFNDLLIMQQKGALNGNFVNGQARNFNSTNSEAPQNFFKTSAGIPGITSDSSSYRSQTQALDMFMKIDAVNPRLAALFTGDAYAYYRQASNVYRSMGANPSPQGKEALLGRSLSILGRYGDPNKKDPVIDEKMAGAPAYKEDILGFRNMAGKGQDAANYYDQNVKGAMLAGLNLQEAVKQTREYMKRDWIMVNGTAMLKADVMRPRGEGPVQPHAGSPKSGPPAYAYPSGSSMGVGMGGYTPGFKPASGGAKGGAHVFALQTSPRRLDAAAVSPSTMYQKLRSRGYNDIQTAALLGSLQGESGFNPTAVGDGGKALGLAQWNDRRGALIAYARRTRRNVYDVDTQLDFMAHEFRTTENRAWQMLASARTVQEGMNAMKAYERYGVEGPRRQFAEQHYRAIKARKYG